jgi:osmotically-inducible protein OsmY
MDLWRFMMTGSLVVVCLCAAIDAQAQEGTGERIGDKVDRAIGQLREGAKDVADWVREGFEEARVAVDRLSVVGRVYARLHWDKTLHDAAISVDVDKEGNTTLRGAVPNEEAKVKAVQLAGDTVGVQRVTSELSIASHPAQ